VALPVGEVEGGGGAARTTAAAPSQSRQLLVIEVPLQIRDVSGWLP